jgi:hypothetical protein
MAVKRYNGTSWDTVAGLGAQGAPATSSSITTWVKTASGGETSLTGSSDSSTTLAYTPGQEQFFINGVLQVRGSDYTATNGTSITGITALVAGDIATVTSVNAFSVTGAVPLSTVTANGDLIVGTSAGAVGRLGIGSTSQVLTVSGGVPTWATPSSGKVVQIVNATYSTQTIVSSSTFADSGLTATITPTSASNKILVFVTHSGCGKYNSNTALQVRLLRGATTILNIESAAGSNNGTGENMIGSIAANYLDSPATTSATTYKTQINSRANAGSAYFNDATSPGSNSTITLMEVTP